MFGNTENTLWTEKYRPSKLDDYIGNDHIKEKVKIYLENQDVPHLLLAGPAGTGKTSLGKLIASNLDCDLLYINASDENSVEVVRDKVKSFSSAIGFKQWRIVLLDECLEEGTLVTVLRNGEATKIPIEQLNQTSDLVKSFNIETNNIEWQPFYLWDNGIHEIWELKLANGETVRCTENHKWFVYNDQNEIIVVTTKELEKYNHILSPI